MKITDEQARRWAAQWKTAGPALARIRAAEIRKTAPTVVAVQLEAALQAAPRRDPRRGASGMVEQQRVFARARR